VREFAITLPFGTKSPESFADAEYYFVSNTADNPLRNNSITCAQGYNNDESWSCSTFTTSHIVCGHFGVFSFVYPNYIVSENSTNIRMQVRRTGGGHGDVTINYYVKHYTTNDSDLVATAPYTTIQRLDFEDGVIERSFLVTILDDNIVEEDEVFQVVLEVPEGGGSVGAQFRTNVTIVDDDSELISAALSKTLQNTTRVRAGQAFSIQVDAVAANGRSLSTGGERFFAVIENNVEQWEYPRGVPALQQRNALRQVCNISDDGNGVYTVTSPGISEQGEYQLRVWHAFPNSIRGEYFYDGFFQRLAVQRLDHAVNFTWGEGKLIPRGNDYITIRWSGAVLPPDSGTYQFKVEADDHARLWIGGVLLLDHWHEQYVNLEPSREIELTGGILHEVVMEYREVRGEARARLLWGYNGGVMGVIPQTNLYSLFEVGRSPVLVSVLSADTDASTTECTGAGLYEGTAFHEGLFTVCPRDPYRNLRDDDDLFYMSSQLFFANLTLVDDLSHGGVGAEVIYPTKEFNPTTACFDFTYTPERAGDFRLEIYYETARGEGTAQVAGSPFYLTVAPDRMSGPKSLVHGLSNPLYAEAGSCHNFTIVARDNAENYLFKGGDGIQAYMYRVDYYTDEYGSPMPITVPSVAPTPSPTGLPSTLFTNTHFTTSPESDAGQAVVRNGEVYDHQDGNYTVQICPVISGVYETHLMLNSRGVSNQPYKILAEFHSRLEPSGRGEYHGQYIADSPYSLVVSHTVASGITTTAEGQGLTNATVGVPVSFMVTVRDPYDNVLRTSDPVVEVTAKLDRSPNSTVNIWDFGNGSYNVEYNPDVSGPNLVSVYVDGIQIQGSPFSVPFLDGRTSADYSFAVGQGLHSGRSGDLSYFEVYAFDLDGNRKTHWDDVFTFSVNGTNNLTGTMQPCPSPPEVNHPVCGIDDAAGGHYFGVFRPVYTGDIVVSVFLQNTSEPETYIELFNSPFEALITPSAPLAEITDISGTLYDNVAGVTARVNLHLRDYFSNKLQSGGRDVELVLLGVGVDWGTPQPLREHQGLPETHFYRGFYEGYPDVYGVLTDHLDGSYSIDYNAPIAGEYVMRLALSEDGLNATYFNNTDFGYLIDQDFNDQSFVVGQQGRDVNLGSSISWTGDLGRRPGSRGDLGAGTYFHRFGSRTEQNISVDLRNIDMDDYIGNSNRTRYHFRDEFWSARWTGMITPEYAEVYTFTVELDSDSTAKLWIAGRGLEFNNSQSSMGDLLINADGAQSLSGTYNFSDTKYREFRVDFVHHSGDALLKFYWESPSTPRRLIPTTAFRHWRNISHFNTTIHPAPLCSSCSTAFGDALTNARVAVKKSFWVYARDEFGNLMQAGGDVPTMVAVGKNGIAFRGDVTDYGNSTYLVEYYATQAGSFRMYVSMGCCAPHPNIGYPAELHELKPLLIQDAPFLLQVESAPMDQTRSIAVGDGLLGGTVGEVLSFTVLYRDIHNNPTTLANVSSSEVSVTFIEKTNSNTFVPSLLRTAYAVDRVTVEYTMERAGHFLMYVALASDYGANASKQIIASPFEVTMHPAKANASLTVCRGAGLRQGRVNSSVSFEIQLYDEFNNNLIIGGNRFYVRLQGDAAYQQRRLDVTPHCVDTQNGRAICSYSALYPGPHQLTIRLLNNSVSQPGGLGLTGRYFTSSDGAVRAAAAVATSTAAAFYSRIDARVQFTWSDGRMIPAQQALQAAGTSTAALDQQQQVSVVAAGQSVRWDGYLVAPRTAAFWIVARTVLVNASVYIDDALVFDTALGISAPIDLVQDAAYAIRVVAVALNTEASIDIPADSPVVSEKSIDLRWATGTIREYSIPPFFLYDSATDIALSPFPVNVTSAT